MAERCNEQLPQTAKRVNRRRLLSVGVLSLSAATALSVRELLKPKSAQEENVKPPPDFLTFLQILHQTVGEIPFEEKHTKENASKPGPLVPEMAEMADAAVERLRREKLTDVIMHSYNWAKNYQLPSDKTLQMDPEELDCNDPVRRVCEQLSRYGVPMYILSIWPQKPRRRLFSDWHQMATCKLGEKVYLIIDHGTEGTWWHGTLHEFVEQYGTIPMSIIPSIGIAKYVTPKHDIPPARFLMQLKYITDEEDMESLNAELPSSSGRVLT